MEIKAFPGRFNKVVWNKLRSLSFCDLTPFLRAGNLMTSAWSSFLTQDAIVAKTWGKHKQDSFFLTEIALDLCVQNPIIKLYMATVTKLV